jgi:hypothetical protein
MLRVRNVAPLFLVTVIGIGNGVLIASDRIIRLITYIGHRNLGLSTGLQRATARKRIAGFTVSLSQCI